MTKFPRLGSLIGSMALLVSIAAGSTQATTYYVSSSSGNNANNGTSTSTPWADTTPVNSHAFAAGDQVLFKRGDVFRTPLWPTADGAAGNPITFADYGSGVKPTFNGSTVMNNASFVHTSGNVYTYQFPTSTTVSTVWLNKQFLIDIWANDLTTVVRDPSNTPLCWKYDQSSGVLTISTAGGAPTGLWEAGTTYNMIENGNPNTSSVHNHLVFRNLISDQSCQYGNFGYGVRTEGGTDITIDSCEAYRSGKHSFGAINSTQVTYTNCIAAYPAPNQGGFTAYVSYGDNAAMPNQTSTYTNCISYHCEDTWQPGNFQYENFVDHSISPVTLNITITNMQALSTAGGDGAFTTLDSTPGPIKWTGGVCQGPMNTIGGNPLTIDGLNMNGAWAVLIIGSANSVIQNCLLTGLYPAYRLQSTMIENDGNNNTFRFNTLVMDPGAGNNDSCFYNAGTGTNFYGNIVVSTGYNIHNNSSFAIEDYNEYLSGTGNIEPHGLSVASPGFTNAAAGDYLPVLGSPSIDSVPTSVVSLATPIPLDYLGKSRLVNGSYDMGAYERQSVSAAHPVITSSLTATANYGNRFDYQIEGSNNPTSYSASGLPAGLSINTSTGAIGGVSNAMGTYNVTVTATNSYGSGSSTLVLTVGPIASTPYTGSAYGANTEIDAANFDLGGQGVAYNEWYGTGGNNTYRKDNANMELTTTTDPDQVGGWAVYNPDGGEWVDYTINLPSNANYTFQLRTSTFQTSALHIEIDGVNVTGTINLPNTGGLNNYQTTTTSSVALTAGLHVMRVAFEYYGFNLHWIKVNGGGAPAAPVVTSAGTASGTAGSAFSYQITATNSPTSYGASSLPAGVTVNTSTGLISGTPTTAGTYNATVTATNAGGTGSKAVTITINPAAPAAPVVTSAGTASGTAGTSFSYQITATNSPNSYGASSLPAGVTVNTSTGLISGTPSTAGTYNATVTATNAGGTGSKAVTITIGAGGGGTAFNIYAISTVGTTPTHGGADNGNQAYNSALLGSTATYGGSTFTYGPANAADAWNNTTVTLPAGNYTALKMIGTAVQGNVSNQTFVVHYTDGTSSTFTQSMHDWKSSGTFAGESTVSTQSTQIDATGAAVAPATYVHGYTFTLTGASVQSITLPATRQVIAFGFATGTASGSAPVINSALSTSGTVGTALSYTITATNSPTSYNATPLPAGLSVNTSTGVISGTPTTAGTTNTTISATNAYGTGTATLAFTISGATTPFNIYSFFTLGTAVTNGGADNGSNAYEYNLLPASATYNGSTFSFGPANAANSWNNTTVNLPPGTYTTLNMLGTAVQGNVTSQTFVVHYTDGTSSTFTQSMHDWKSSGAYTGETTVVTMANQLNSAGAATAPQTYIHGYTFALTGHSVQSITLPATRQVLAFGFAGH